MNTQNTNDNIAVVRRLYEARGNPEIIRQLLAPDVRWEVDDANLAAAVRRARRTAF